MLARTGFVTLASMAISLVLTYLFQVIMARRLSAHEYGDLSAIIAVLNVTTIPIFGLSTSITRDVVAMAGYGGQIRAVIQPHVPRVVAVTVATIGGVIWLSPWLVDFLQLSSVAPLAFLALLVTLTNAVGVGRAVLVGLHDFAALAVNQITEALVRLASGASLALWGIGESSGFAGYSVGLLAALTLQLHRTRPLPSGRIGETKSRPRDISWQAIVIAAAFNALLNLDIIVVKHFLPGDEAGHYAALSVFAKALFVVTSAFDVALFPAATAARVRSAPTFAPLLRTVVSVGAVLVPILVLYWLAASFLIGVLMGEQYAQMAALLAPYALGVSLIGIAAIFARFRLAIGRGRPSAVFAALVVCELLGFLALHQTLQDIVLVVLLSGIAALVLTFPPLMRAPTSRVASQSGSKCLYP
jgi:O-antigen/teichoic acid export membrane protein